MRSQIPIQNVYYLFCYAWNRFPEGSPLAVGAADCPDIANLLARVLLNGLRRLRRRGLTRAYLDREEELRSVRGKILIDQTIRRNLVGRSQAVCEFDDLDHDCPPNQIIKATARQLAFCVDIDSGLSNELKATCRDLSQISDVRLSARSFKTVRLSRNQAHYDLVMKVCQLAFECALPEEGGKNSRFADVLNDQAKMPAVFEEFVRNFYKAELSDFSVSRTQIPWRATAANNADLAYLPTMNTDVTLRSKSRTVILDAKFYRETLSTFRQNEKIWSSNLYQLFSYLKNADTEDHPGLPEGILLYPTVQADLDLRFNLSGHDIRVSTVNLNDNWRSIHKRLLSIVEGDRVGTA